jgi:16S rRNA (cytidine1402-2'-O)-methyltransferase
LRKREGCLTTKSMATLYIVATPIGNLEDITLRALETLKKADSIACEDTRQTLKLLSRYGISKPLLSCYAYREERGSEKVLSLLNEGKTIAYASDAGTPALSDPGALLVRKAREAGHAVVPIPGPSAFAALLSVAGIGGKTTTFEGFLSPKAGRRRARLTELLGRGEAFILYESPYRVVKLLEDLADIESGRFLVVGREMTKIHEEFVEGSAAKVAADFRARESIKGEFSVFVSGRVSGEEESPPE